MVSDPALPASAKVTLSGRLMPLLPRYAAQLKEAREFKVIRGFKDFLLRGSVVDLAVAVVIGVAFGLVVSAFTDKVVKPLINAITPAGSPGLGFTVIPGKDTTYVDFAAVITAVINFMLVALVVYFVIVTPMNAIKTRRERGKEPGPAGPTDVELLTEIRDLLRQQQRSD
jgi:large conductance mechanosensitive channel